MKRFIVVADCAAELPADSAIQDELHIIPLWIHFEEHSCRDGVDLTPEQFHPLLDKVPDLPTTSQPSAGEFLDLCRGLAGEAEAIDSAQISTGLLGHDAGEGGSLDA